MSSVTFLIGRQSALRFRTDDGQRIVERFGVTSARAVGSNGMAAEVEAAPIETVRLPLAPDAAGEWIRSVLPEFDIELTSAALRGLTDGYVSPLRLTAEQTASVIDDALESIELERQYKLIVQRRDPERKGEKLSPEELEELSDLVGYDVESISWEEGLRRLEVEDQESEAG